MKTSREVALDQRDQEPRSSLWCHQEVRSPERRNDQDNDSNRVSENDRGPSVRRWVSRPPGRHQNATLQVHREKHPTQAAQGVWLAREGDERGSRLRRATAGQGSATLVGDTIALLRGGPDCPGPSSTSPLSTANLRPNSTSPVPSCSTNGMSNPFSGWLLWLIIPQSLRTSPF